jgi:hypothetical protein
LRIPQDTLRQPPLFLTTAPATPSVTPPPSPPSTQPSKKRLIHISSCRQCFALMFRVIVLMLPCRHLENVASSRIYIIVSG